MVLFAIGAMLAVPNVIFGTTLPAGTGLQTKTTTAVSTHDRRGYVFKAVLDHNIAHGKTILLKGGTEFLGKVIKSRGGPHESNPLTLDLTDVVLNGKRVHIKTNGPIEVKPPAMNMRQSLYGHTVGKFTFSPGLKLQFYLAEPVNL